MGDLVERLKKVGHIDYDLMDEAAAELLRLKEENARIRNEALEEAAKVAEGNAKEFNFQLALAEGDDMAVGAKSVQIAIAAVIRALKDTEERNP
jgi:hypothetical protein